MRTSVIDEDWGDAKGLAQVTVSSIGQFQPRAPLLRGAMPPLQTWPTSWLLPPGSVSDPVLVLFSQNPQTMEDRATGSHSTMSAEAGASGWAPGRLPGGDDGGSNQKMSGRDPA